MFTGELTQGTSGAEAAVADVSDGREKEMEKNKTEQAGSTPYDTVAIFVISQTGFKPISPSSALCHLGRCCVSELYFLPQ